MAVRSRELRNGEPVEERRSWREERRERLARERAEREQEAAEIEDEDEDAAADDEDRRARPRGAGRTVPGGRALGAVMLAFGLLLWATGARYSVDGAWIGINLFLAWLGLPVEVPAMPWQLYVMLIGMVGMLCSVVEVRLPLRRVLHPSRWRRMGLRAALAVLLGAALLHGGDLGSTWLGVTTPAADSWALTRAVASIPVLAAGWTIVLTYMPEGMIVSGWRLVRTGRI